MAARDVPDLLRGFDGQSGTRRKIVVCARELRQLAQQRARLTPMGQDEYGVTADDTHTIALRRGFATGAEDNKRALSWYAAVPRVARLRNSGRRRPGRSRNSHTIYVT